MNLLKSKLISIKDLQSALYEWKDGKKILSDNKVWWINSSIIIDNIYFTQFDKVFYNNTKYYNDVMISLKTEGWDKARPCTLLMGDLGEMAVLHGNHRINILSHNALDISVPIKFEYKKNYPFQHMTGARIVVAESTYIGDSNLLFYPHGLIPKWETDKPIIEE